ncbi:MAG: OmpH family outer membrane protein [Pirellulaceae bacterium]
MNVRSKQCVALATTLVVFCAINANAQAPRSTSGPVAVVDISYIFQEHNGFKGAMEKMKEDVQQYENLLRQQSDALTKERDKLKAFRAGTPEYKRLEEDLASKAADLQVKMQLRKKEFLQQEAKVYYLTYMQIQQAIEEFATQNGFTLVLRYSGEKIDPEDRNSVLAGVNRAIVFQKNLDITGQILDRLNRASSTARRPAARPTK